MKTVIALFLLASLAIGVGCSTPESRIKKNPDFFASLTPADQQLIREGRVALGFTPDMVKLAVGDPTRVYTRTDASGVSESWSYTTYESDTGMMLYTGYYHRYYRGWYGGYGYGGGYGPYHYPYYGTWGGAYREREYFKVIFTGGKVSAIEQQS